jgi:hypothetical protein
MGFPVTMASYAQPPSRIQSTLPTSTPPRPCAHEGTVNATYWISHAKLYRRRRFREQRGKLGSNPGRILVGSRVQGSGRRGGMRCKCGTSTTSAKTKPSAARMRLNVCNGAKVNPAKNGYNTRIGRCVFIFTMHADNHLTPSILRQVKMNLQDHGQSSCA